MADATVGEWAQRAASLPAALVDATPEAVKASGLVLEAAARANILLATGGDSRLSGARSIGTSRRGRAAGQITLHLNVRGAGRGATAHVDPAGPIMLVEEDTAAHRIPRVLSGRGGRGYRGVRRRVVVVPGLGVFSRVSHPGTRGKHPVQRAFRTDHEPAGRAGVAIFATAARRHLTP